jgi:hypothetical protein
MGPRHCSYHAALPGSWAMVTGSFFEFLEALAVCYAILAGVWNRPGVTQRGA